MARVNACPPRVRAGRQSGGVLGAAFVERVSFPVRSGQQNGGVLGAALRTCALPGSSLSTSEAGVKHRKHVLVIRGPGLNPHILLEADCGVFVESSWRFDGATVHDF
jgi:hypothetical protein